MDIITEDGERIIDVGTYDLWHAVYSTVVVRLAKEKDIIKDAIIFLETGTCKSDDAIKTARQINIIRDGLSKYPPNSAVYDCDDLEKTIPWISQISPVITSCGNLFTTADGQDLFFELVSILTYASIKKVDILVA